ncbi:hydrolase [Bacillus sp. JCM 19046]|nr:hydrolase [Bacillus sp. JCM 19045]GAF19768.1 hydrolase [Bacillus sp. JCM 19046]
MKRRNAMLKSSYLALHGASVYYEWYPCTGRKKGTLCMIHGFFASTHSFSRLISYFRKDYDVLLCDLPGFGRSSKHEARAYSFQAYSTIVVALLDSLRIQQAVLVGHSMGGQVALYTALYHRERVEALILLASSGYLKQVKSLYRLASYLPFASHYLSLYINKPPIELLLQEAVYRKKTLTKAMIHAYKQPLLDTNFAKGLLQLTRQREGDLSPEQLQQITQQTLVITGENDPLIPVETSKRLVRDLPNSRFESLKKCGHLLAEEQTKQTAAKIKVFLQALHS